MNENPYHYDLEIMIMGPQGPKPLPQGTPSDLPQQQLDELYARLPVPTREQRVSPPPIYEMRPPTPVPNSYQDKGGEASIGDRVSDRLMALRDKLAANQNPDS